MSTIDRMNCPWIPFAESYPYMGSGPHWFCNGDGSRIELVESGCCFTVGTWEGGYWQVALSRTQPKPPAPTLIRHYAEVNKLPPDEQAYWNWVTDTKYRGTNLEAFRAGMKYEAERFR